MHPSAAPAWATEDVHLANPDPAWPKLAAAYADEIRGLLGDLLAGSIVHVGSTAVAQLPAKPVIDLQAAATDPATMIAIRHTELSAASWFFVPRELDRRPWRWFLVRADATEHHRLAHLHVMRPDEPRWAEQIAFRDRLRTDRTLAAEYARLKTDAARAHARDREAYTDAKAAFIGRVLDRRP